MFIILQRNTFHRDLSAEQWMEMIVLDHSRIHSEFAEFQRAQFIMIVLLYTFPSDLIIDILDVLVVRDH